MGIMARVKAGDFSHLHRRPPEFAARRKSKADDSKSQECTRPDGTKYRVPWKRNGTKVVCGGAKTSKKTIDTPKGKAAAVGIKKEADDIKQAGSFKGAIGGLKNGKQYDITPEMAKVANAMGVSDLQLSAGRVPKALQASLIKEFDRLSSGESPKESKPREKKPKENVKTEAIKVGNFSVDLTPDQMDEFDRVMSAKGWDTRARNIAEEIESGDIDVEADGATIIQKLKRVSGQLPPPPSDERPPTRRPSVKAMSEEELEDARNSAIGMIQDNIAESKRYLDSYNGATHSLAKGEKKAIKEKKLLLQCLDPKNLKQFYPDPKDRQLAILAVQEMQALSTSLHLPAQSLKERRFPPPNTPLGAATLASYSKALYESVNESLRGTPAENRTDGQKALCWMLESALNQMPRASEHVLHRGAVIPKSLLDNYQVGQTLTERSALSTSEDAGVAEGFHTVTAGDRKQDATVSYRIVPKASQSRGGLIEKISEVKFESEVVFPPDTPFLVADKREVSPGVFEILLEEQ
jgi:hypothetical protein